MGGAGTAPRHLGVLSSTVCWKLSTKGKLKKAEIRKATSLTAVLYASNTRRGLMKPVGGRPCHPVCAGMRGRAGEPQKPQQGGRPLCQSPAPPGLRTFRTCVKSINPPESQFTCSAKGRKKNAHEELISVRKTWMESHT